MTATTAERTRANGYRNSTRITGGRDRRLPWVALGVVLILGGGLAAALLVQSVGERSQVLAAARPIAQGQVVTAEDLRVVDAAFDTAVGTIPASSWNDLIGQQATTRIVEGSILAPGTFAAQGGMPEGTVIVGAPLGPGQLPVPTLRSGQRVRMLSAGGDGSERHVLGEATIYTTTAGPQSTVFVSLAVADDLADEVAEVVARQRLRLILLPDGG